MEEEVELAWGLNKRKCHELALVLQSREIPSRTVLEANGFTLIVAGEYFEAAREELVQYQSENDGAVRPSVLEYSPRAGRMEAFGFVVLTTVFFAADKLRFFGLDWIGEGRTDSRFGISGNLERAITSLTLHADLRHMLSNLLYGCLFSLLLSQAVGGGVAWFGIILSGFLGNLLSLWVSSPEGAVAHSSIGASTMVFGMLGMLAAYQWRVRKRAQLGLKQWAPLIAGVVLLAFFGFGGGARTNYMAHLTGFLSGVGIGVFVGGKRPLHFPARVQHALLAGALGAVVGAWVLAFIL